LKNGLMEFPLRVIASGSGSIDPRANIFKQRFSPVVILTTARIPKSRLKALRDVADAVEVFGREKIDFPRAIRWLRKEWKIRRLLCEGGGELHNAIVQADVMDELHLTICPAIFGGRAAPTIAEGDNPKRLADAKSFHLASLQRVKNEIFTIWRRRPKD
jgi:2,5-diamino-6-(ribosylamino)-4(3H)-pyrimidinone 5'-phosphate reductase